MAAPGRCLVPPSPPGPPQRFVRRLMSPYQPVEQPPDLGHRQGYQLFVQAGRAPFSLGFQRLAPDHRQAGVGQHRQGDVPVPAIPFTSTGPTHLSLSLKHSSSQRVRPPAPVPSRINRAEADVIGQLPGLGDAAPDQQPVPLARLLQGPDLHPRPIVYRGPLAPSPALRRTQPGSSTLGASRSARTVAIPCPCS